MQAHPFRLSEPAPARGAVEAVRFVLRQPSWFRNVLMAVVYLVIPVVGPMALHGYLCEVVQRLHRRHPEPLPLLDFTEFTAHLKRGVAPFVASLAASAPAMLLSLVAGVAMAFAVAAAGMSRAAGASGGMAGGIGTSGATLVPAVGLGITEILVVGIVLLMFVATLATAVLTNALVLRAELTEDLGRTFELRQVMEYARATLGITMLRTLTFGVLAFGVALLGLLACYVGVFVAAALLQIASAHLRFQIYEQYLERGGMPIELPAPAPGV
jgi:hypothetical protein